ncbi:MAG TPA: GNAT family N-acetyltransferase [Actinobacteria bacterium]|nr:GNAT family N-acetyltransferase [Actinomycetota bacterium]
MPGNPTGIKFYEMDFKKLKSTVSRNGKVLIRPLKRSDLYQLIKWLKNPEINKFLSSDFSDLDSEKEERWFREMSLSVNDFVFAIETRQEKKYIGNCGLHKINWGEKKADFGIAIGDKNYWGKGYGRDAIGAAIKFAFKKLGLEKIALSVYEYNKRAIKSYTKCGFKKKEILKKDHLYNNIYWDTIIMEIKVE